jgi:2-haloacid dehalogenase
VVVFDVNQTLSDLAPMADRFVEVGAPGELGRVWFATLLRDGFARTAAGASERFAVLGEETLRTLLQDVALDRELEDAVAHVMNGFLHLPLHPDVPEGVRRLRSAGLGLITLTNGATRVAETLLETAGLRGEFEQLLSVEDAGAWKPAAVAYQYAARRCATPLHRMLLVAVHPWDIHGAAAAGMSTAWINRVNGRYPAHFTSPDVTISSLTDLAGRLPD